jgi:hypothetical protein
MELKDGDIIKIDLSTGRIMNRRNQQVLSALPFSDVQLEVWQKGGLLGLSPLKTE